MSSLKYRGLKPTIKLLRNYWHDRNFDKVSGLNTSLVEDIKNYVGSNKASEATFYAPTKAAPFKELISVLQIPTTGNFVDYGCGKGRALILAAEAGFAELRGIEFVEEFIRIAEQNLQISQFKNLKCRFFNIDAREYLPEMSDRVFYFYHPFNDAILFECLDKIQHSVQRHPRPVYILIHQNLRSDWQPLQSHLPNFDCTLHDFSGEHFAFFTKKNEP